MVPPNCLQVPLQWLSASSCAQLADAKLEPHSMPYFTAFYKCQGIDSDFICL